MLILSSNLHVLTKLTLSISKALECILLSNVKNWIDQKLVASLRNFVVQFLLLCETVHSEVTELKKEANTLIFDA